MGVLNYTKGEVISVSKTDLDPGDVSILEACLNGASALQIICKVGIFQFYGFLKRLDKYIAIDEVPEGTVYITNIDGKIILATYMVAADFAK